jgi:hypothetical protein
MSEIVNLRRARKAKAREAAAEAAAVNRVRFGQSRAVRELQEHARLFETRKLDGHFLAPGADDATVEDGAKGSG